MRPRHSALIFCFALLTAACGRKGALIYPDMLVPAAPSYASGQQSGLAVKLKFALPDKDISGKSLQGVTGVKISRMESETGKVVCRSCLADYLLLRTVYLGNLPPGIQRFGNRLILLDSEVKPSHSYSYRIAAFTADGADGASAAIDGVHIGSPFSGPVLTAESHQTEIRLQYAMPSPASGRVLGYNLYRSTTAGGISFQPLNRELLKDKEFVDRSLARGVKYRYTARALLEVTTENVVESLGSAEVEVMLKDDE
ncbi:MAG TPA: hypothetical protein HPP97_00570 [Desulfuromonadales bacterium]|nr:hypothetical protein [Desulfuromonadales bacterium]